jgi:hypothetical protein
MSGGDPYQGAADDDVITPSVIYAPGQLVDPEGGPGA